MKKIIAVFSFVLIFGVTHSQISMNATPQITCVGSEVVVSLSGVTNSVAWDFGENANPATASTTGPHIITYDTPGTKKVLVIVNAGSVTIRDSIEIEVSQLDFDDVDMSLTFDPSAMYILNGSVSVNSSTSLTPYSYQWNIDTVTSVFNTDYGQYEFPFSRAGRYFVQMTMRDAGGCEVVKSDSVTAVELFQAPNVFTPNGDGINDAFKVMSTGLIEFSMEIYDRWGSVVFNPKLVANQLIWDGRNSAGIEVTTGVYFYVITPKDVAIEPLTGFVHVFR